MRKICIVDTETTSLNPDTREAWDIAWQVYNPDTDEIENAFIVLENVLRDRPRTREISLALTKLDECYMWTLQSIYGKCRKNTP